MIRSIILGGTKEINLGFTGRFDQNSKHLFGIRQCFMLRKYKGRGKLRFESCHFFEFIVFNLMIGDKKRESKTKDQCYKCDFYLDLNPLCDYCVEEKDHDEARAFIMIPRQIN